jgi:hypothetical protein
MWNVQDFGAVGDGTTNDATAVDAAVAAAVAAGGGVVLFPAGRYLYSGTGVVCAPSSGSAGSVVLRGEGPLSSQLLFSSVSNADCIKLSPQSSMGSGLNEGCGIASLYVTGPSGKNLIVMENAENFLIDNLWTESGAVALTVKESRMGVVRASVLRGWAGTGLKIVGESFAANFYSHLNIQSTSATGAAIDYTKTTVSDAGGVYFDHVVVNAAGSNGFLFSCTTAQDLFIFMTGCAVDGAFPGPAVKAVRVGNLNVANCHLLNGTSGGVAVELDACSNLVFSGGRTYSTGSGAADLSLKNACSYLTVVGTALTGPVQSLKVDSTTHTNCDFRPSLSQATTYCNDFTKIFASGNRGRLSTPPHVLTDSSGGKAGAFGLLNDGSGTPAKYLRTGASGQLEIVDSAFTSVLASLADNGAWTFALGTLVSAVLYSDGFKGSKDTNDGNPFTVTLRKSRNNGPCSAGEILGDYGWNLVNSSSTEVQAAMLRAVAGGVTAGSEAVDLVAYLRAGGTLAERWRLLAAGGEVHVSPNGAQWILGQASELVTLSTTGTTTDTAASLLPANSILEAVVARVTTTIAGATNWRLGDATTAGRFSAASTSLTAGSTAVGTVQADQTGAAGPRQTTAAKLRITTTGTPTAGALRVTVFYRQFVAPTS